ncbi:hypothetical protein ACJMK2_015968 [Sinanodonta woodiana]|uniref:RING-CH-type domain-containing protein n=1 Tax=Sinanodonta woodiana TaxID=1069815 RepID=A0ABD3US47_SINWO
MTSDDTSAYVNIILIMSDEKSGKSDTSEEGQSQDFVDLCERNPVSDQLSQGLLPVTPTQSVSENSRSDIVLDQPTDSWTKVFFSSSSSSSVSVCRICQDDSLNSGERLSVSHCDCKGNLAQVHRSCLGQWVRHRGSNSCEICHAVFAEATPPSSPLGVNQRETLTTLAWQLERFHPLNRRKRAAFAAIVIFLLLVTAVTAVLTVGADRDFRDITSNPWNSKEDVNKAHIVFSICVSFLFFSGTLSLGLMLLWLVLECCYILQRRRILERAIERMLAESNL